MKPVYTLAEALIKDPARVAKAQSLTLDSSRPHMGLKGSHGRNTEGRDEQATCRGRCNILNKYKRPGSGRPHWSNNGY